MMHYFEDRPVALTSRSRLRSQRALKNDATRNPIQGPNLYSVVVTRPVFGADTLPRRISDRNMKCTVFPLLEILPPPDPTVVAQAVRNLGQYALVIFVSPSAVSAFISFLDSWPLDVAIGVVGQGSAHRLNLYGFTQDNTKMIVPSPGETADSESLIKQLDLNAMKNARVLIVRGDQGRNLLTNLLLANGTTVDHVAAYRRVAPKLDPLRLEKLRHLVWSRNTWLITSVEAISILVEQVRVATGLEGLAEIKKQSLIVGHRRIYDAALQAGFTDITFSNTTDDELLGTTLSLRNSHHQR